MRVKDVIRTKDEYDLSDNLIWFLTFNGKIVGSTKEWRFVGNNKMIGLACPFPDGLMDDCNTGTLGDFLKVGKYIPEDTELYIEGPGFKHQMISNWKIDHKKFSSEVFFNPDGGIYVR